MSALLFGTGGTPLSTPPPKSSLEGIRRISELGLGCMELEFVHGVRMSEREALAVAATAANRNIRLTAHAPYYINLNAQDKEKLKASQFRLLQAVHIASVCGALDVVFHAAFYMENNREDVYRTVKKSLEEVLEQIKPADRKVRLRPELMGKTSQFGTLDEIIALCRELEGVAPCLDFAHWHARSGQFNSYDEFANVLLYVKKQLGQAALENLHLHVSGIQYGGKGEQKHLELKDSDLH
jgi:deoxyribonuclease IV